MATDSNQTDNVITGWEASAAAWIAAQGETGDVSRREILDPCLDTLLGDVSGLQALDVGCGEGRYARKLTQRGAIVTGIDPTEPFIHRARALDPQSAYHLAQAENLPLEDLSFDLVLSYLSIIDIPDYRAAIREMCRVVKPAGSIVLVTVSNIASTTATWVKDAEGKKLYRTVDRYMEEFHVDLDWSNIRVQNYHRPLSHVLLPFFDRGMVITDFIEPLPQIGSPLYEDEHRVPTFQVIRFLSRPT